MQNLVTSTPAARMIAPGRQNVGVAVKSRRRLAAPRRADEVSGVPPLFIRSVPVTVAYVDDPAASAGLGDLVVARPQPRRVNVESPPRLLRPR